MKKKNLISAEILRQKAEEQLKLRQIKVNIPASTPDMIKLIHQLKVHQIELEMQNEELVAATEKAELSKDKYTKLFDFAPTGYFSLSKNGNITEINFAAARLLNKERSHLIEKTFALFVSENSHAVFATFLKNVFTSKLKQTCEVTLATDGNQLTHVNIAGVMDETNELYLLTLVDITERKQMEDALHESETNFRTLFNTITDAVFELDYDGRYVSIAPTSPEILFKPSEEMIGKTLHEVFPKPHADKFLGFIRRCLDENKTSSIDYSLIIKNKTIWFEGRATPKTKNSVLFIAHDITNRKKAEQALQESKEKLRESNRTKDKFFNIIAHDLRSPFNSILGFADLLHKDFDEYNTEEKKSFIGLLHKSVNRAYKLLDNLLIWSSSQRGNIVFNPEEINLYLLTVETIEFVNQVAKNKSIKILNQTPVEIFVQADKEMLSIIIRNLISNAIKFTPKGGEITINARLIADKKNTEAAEVSISDNGVGIASAVQPKLFDVGQKSTKGTDNEAGTGLGLVLCKEFTEKHGGKIWVESEKGIGSTFYFTLPYDKTNTNKNSK